MSTNAASFLDVKRSGNRRELNLPAMVIGLIIAAALSVILAVGLGPVSVAPADAARMVGSIIPQLKDYITPTWNSVEGNMIFGLRVPRVLLGMIVGS